MTYKPTDAELDALRQADNGELNFVTLRQFRIIARAVLAKWGSSIVATKISIPTNTMEQEFQNYYRRGFESGKKDGSPVVAGEVASHRVMRKGLDGNWVCDGKYWSDGPPSKELVESICSDKDRWRVDVAYTTPQPTHAQAGAVPLTAEQAQDLIDLESWGPEAISLNAQLLRTIRRTEAAHGIGETP